LSGNLLIKTIGRRPGQKTSPAFTYSQVVEPYEAELGIEIYGFWSRSQPDTLLFTQPRNQSWRVPE